MKKIIQYVGTAQQINKAIKNLEKSNTKLIDLTGDKELKDLFNLYFSINPLIEDTKELLKTIKEDRVKRYVINDCDHLKFFDIEPLIQLYRENDIEILLFSNDSPLDLKIPFKSSELNNSLTYYDYNLK